MNTLEILGSILSILVGFHFILKAIINGAVSNLYKKQLENHKFLLKNSEVVFKYKLDASKRLYKILREIIPERSRPDMEWDEACEIMASSFSSHEKALKDFLCDYQSTLSNEALEKVRKAISACSDGQFEFYWTSESGDAEVSSTGVECASELYDALNEAVEMLREEVHGMISLPSK